MFSETILIEHGQIQYCSASDQSQAQDRRLTSNGCNGGIGTYYKTHMVEKQYSLEQLNVRDKVDEGAEEEVRCFVRSEIKWVFLKNIKVVICELFKSLKTLQKMIG